MKPRSALQARLLFVAAGILAAGFVPVASGTAAAPTRGAAIGVQAGQYVLAGRAIDDLDTLETELRAAGATAVQLDICGDGAARALMAAAHRFSDLPLSLRYAGASSPSCTMSTLAARVGLRSGPKPYGIDDAQVQRYWQNVSP